MGSLQNPCGKEVTAGLKMRGITRNITAIMTCVVAASATVACVQVKVWKDAGAGVKKGVTQVSSRETRSQTKPIGEETLGPLQNQCKLGNLKNQLQEDTSWCWAASTQMVIEYVNPAVSRRQCDFVSTVLASQLRIEQQNSGIDIPLECCQAIGEPAPGGGVGTTPTSASIAASQRVCISGGWPEMVFDNLADNSGGREVYGWDKTRPLNWERLTKEICDNRPFIFVVRFPPPWRGRHTSVVGGYGYNEQERYVEVYDHFPVDGESDFYLVRYGTWLGNTGEWINEWNYHGIQP